MHTISTSGWLLLTDYASKYRVSISTLRRRIKAGQLEHRLEYGKYLIPDVEMPPYQPYQWNFDDEAVDQDGNATAGPKMGIGLRQDVNEIKRAYLSVLQEKDQQILSLRGEVSDLKTLVQVLESHHARMQGQERNAERGKPTDLASLPGPQNL